MRKLLLIFFACAIFAQVEGQAIIRANPFARAQVSADEALNITEEEYQAVYDEFTDPPSNTIANLQNAMVKSLVDGGYWARMDLFYVMANKVEADALLMWLDPAAGTYDLVETGAGNLTFTSYEGFAGDGTNYLTTGWDEATNGSNAQQNSATLGIYVRTDRQAAEYEIGTTDGTNQFSLATRYDANGLYSRINATTAMNLANADSRGFYLSTRTASNNTNLYKNGAYVGNNTNSSTAEPNVDLSILARATAAQSQKQVSIAMVMNAVSAADAAAINTIIETYMDALGKGVQ
jgi:hypothetical protein